MLWPSSDLQEDELQRVLEDPGASQKELWWALERGLTFGTYWVTVLHVKFQLKCLLHVNRVNSEKVGIYLWSKWEESAREAGTFNTPWCAAYGFCQQMPFQFVNFVSMWVSWGECCPLEPCGRVRHLWDAAKICMLDLLGHGPWGTCTEALPHSWKIRLYCDFRQHQSSIAPFRDTCHDDMTWVQLFQFKSEVVHAAVGSGDHVEVVVASL